MSGRLCHTCKIKTMTKDVRDEKLGTYRRHQCPRCLQKFSTLEVRVEQFKKMVALWNTVKGIVQ